MLRKIERYEVEEEIGHGGMATVYRALDTKLDRKVALKVMHPHLRGAKEARARFRREAQSVARLAHPRILEIYDYSGEGSEESYIASKLLTGPTLRRWAEEHAPIPAEIAACVGIEICDALGAAHDKKIIHRDVKPENILLHENRELVLTDFGIADMVDSQSMTATGQILGSPGHMAPEQIEGGATDARTDVFALGTVLYYLATGRLPFSGKNPHQILKRIADGEYADPLRVAPRIGGRFAAILRRALARSPDDRYPSAAAFADDLRAFVAEAGIDDAHAALARYLASPSEEAAALLPKVIAANVARGKEARDAGRLPEASDRFGRVLALDEGNAEVLALVQRMQADARRPSPMPIAAAIAGALALALVGWFAFGDGGTGASADPDAGVPVVPADLLDAPPSADAPTVDTSIGLLDASEADGALLDGGRDAPRARVTPGSTGPRLVIIRPSPDGVFVSIDGGAEQSIAQIRDGVELPLGSHHVVIRPNDAATWYVPAEFDLPVTAGTEPMVVTRTLRLRDAGLIVRTRGALGSGTRGTVTIGSVTGNTRELIAVPMTARDERFTFRVVAPGHRPYEGTVELRAGDDETVEIELEPETTTPDEPPPEPPEAP